MSEGVRACEGGSKCGKLGGQSRAAVTISFSTQHLHLICLQLQCTLQGKLPARNLASWSDQSAFKCEGWTRVRCCSATACPLLPAHLPLGAFRACYEFPMLLPSTSYLHYPLAAAGNISSSYLQAIGGGMGGRGGYRAATNPANVLIGPPAPLPPMQGMPPGETG